MSSALRYITVALSLAIVAPHTAHAEEAAVPETPEELPSVATKNSTKGRLVIRNDASVGLGFNTPLQRCCNVGLYRGGAGFSFGPGFELRPALDYFVIDGLSVGGVLQISFLNIPTGFGNADVFIFAVMPRIGYNLALTDRISLWPQVAAGFGLVETNGLNAILPLDIYVPVYFHLTDNFFIGLGPGLAVQPIDNNSYWTVDVLRFSIGGSVDLSAGG